MLTKILNEIKLESKPDAIGKTSSGEVVEFKVDEQNRLECDAKNLISLKILNPKVIRFLNCSRNQLTTLDVSKCVNLEYLWCYHNGLTSLDVSNNVNLLSIGCSSNNIKSLNISNCVNLEDIDYDEETTELIENPINEIKVESDKPDAIGKDSLGKYMEHWVDECGILSCFDENLISLKILNPNIIKELHCSHNELIYLDISKGINLEVLYCSDNIIE